MKKFSIEEMFNEQSLNSAKSKYKVVMLNYEDLIPDPENEVSLSDIDLLAANISQEDLLEVFRVKELDNGKYMLISGHRRHSAIKLLREENDEKFVQVPAIIENSMEWYKERIRRMSYNHQRNMSVCDRFNEIKSAHEIFIDPAAKEALAIKGREREWIADQIGMRPTQVEEYLKVVRSENQMVISLLLKDEISLKRAVEILQNPDSFDMDNLEDDVEEESLKTKSKTKNNLADDSKYEYATEIVRRLLGTKVKINSKKIEIWFEGTEDLNRVLEIIGALEE